MMAQIEEIPVFLAVMVIIIIDVSLILLYAACFILWKPLVGKVLSLR